MKASILSDNTNMTIQTLLNKVSLRKKKLNIFIIITLSLILLFISCFSNNLASEIIRAITAFVIMLGLFNIGLILYKTNNR